VVVTDGGRFGELVDAGAEARHFGEVERRVLTGMIFPVGISVSSTGVYLSAFTNRSWSRTVSLPAPAS